MIDESCDLVRARVAVWLRHPPQHWEPDVAAPETGTRSWRTKEEHQPELPHPSTSRLNTHSSTATTKQPRCESRGYGDWDNDSRSAGPLADPPMSPRNPAQKVTGFCPANRAGPACPRHLADTFWLCRAHSHGSRRQPGGLSHRVPSGVAAGRTARSRHAQQVDG